MQCTSLCKLKLKENTQHYIATHLITFCLAETLRHSLADLHDLVVRVVRVGIVHRWTVLCPLGELVDSRTDHLAGEDVLLVRHLHLVV